MTTTPTEASVVIVGAGPAGTACALRLVERGIHPVIVERDVFPRYHIGESLTGECAAQLNALGFGEELDAGDFPVKRGVSVWGPTGSRFFVPVAKRGTDGDLLETRTWQVARDRFDGMLLDVAVARGAQHVHAAAGRVLRDSGGVRGIELTAEDGSTTELRSEVVVDASGQATYLASRGITGEKTRGRYDNQVAVFSQVSGAIRDEGDHQGDTLIFYQEKNHWAWFIPLSEEVTSIGVVVPSETLKASGGVPETVLHQWSSGGHKEFSRRVGQAPLVAPVRSASSYSYRVDGYTGRGFLCVGDAHRFIDPIFSFGVFLSMAEASFAAKAISDYLDGVADPSGNPFGEYERVTARGQALVQDIVDMFWEYPLAFQRMVHHSHREEMVDLFAGRIYDDPSDLSDAAFTMRRMLSRLEPSASSRSGRGTARI